MATLQKFKLLATQCAIAGSPTRSPSNSPVIHLRRRKTLRMLLSRSSGSGRQLFRGGESPDRQGVVPDSNPPEKSKGLLSHTLKDLFISSPPPKGIQEDNLSKATEKIRGGDLEAFPSSIINREDGSAARRFTFGSYRFRLLSRAWRPVLIAIPESKETA
ncbi:uncharacterized protein LOC122650850 [Telopea speciosissima]|uniref:uncharacterized protein LOC122650850 n=1 Tax=Telopea speciosissima TaxID=54955 RepID=UPI001CC47A33|nr:uncharacterized protein LOC122650850 [Telopea speciosissima]